MKIYLLDPKTEIFQSFQDSNQLYSFLNRCSKNCRGKIIIVRLYDKAKVIELKNEMPAEIFTIVGKLINELMGI